MLTDSAASNGEYARGDSMKDLKVPLGGFRGEKLKAETVAFVYLL